MNDVTKTSKAISQYAEVHKLKLHPGQDPEKWAELVVSKGGCPCIPGRKTCPCEFVLKDVARLGRCRCGLFVNDAYLAEYNKLLKGAAHGSQGQKRVFKENQHQRLLYRG